MALSLLEVGYVALAQGSPLDAARIWARTELLLEEIDAPVQEGDRLEYNEHLASARAATGDVFAFDHAWLEGRAMTLEQVINYALSEPGA